jgi:predicted AlkP superfamily pyrophosphatase or phosphodiesterase
LLAGPTLLALSLCAQPLVGHVVVIGVDGLSPIGIERTATPNIDDLVRRGAHTWRARGVMPTSSSPNWASMIMGAGPEQHGVTSNDWQPDRFDIAPVEKGSGGIFPTIYGVLRQQQPGAVIGVFHDWTGYARLLERDVVNVIENPKGARNTSEGAVKTMAAATAYLRAAKPTLLFIQLDHVDHAGHQMEWFSEPYEDAVRLADKLIGNMIAAIDEAGLTRYTVVLVTADHGGKGKKHGGATMDEILIPWVIAGPVIKEGFEITDSVNTYDTAATLAMLFDVKPPACWIARPVVSAFRPAAKS